MMGGLARVLSALLDVRPMVGELRADDFGCRYNDEHVGVLQ